MFIKTLDDLSLFVNTDDNNKEPLLFIHGGPGAWSYSFEYFAKEYVQLFSNGIYLDQRGCGRSEGHDKNDYSLESMVKDIEAVRKTLGFDKMSIIAHSFGGIIAVNYVAKYQQHVNKLILSNCTLYLNDSIKEQIDYGYQLINETPSYDDLMDTFQKMYRKLNEMGLYRTLQFRNNNAAHLLEKIDLEIKNYTFNMKALNIDEYLKCYYELTKDIKVPTLIISGKGDYAVGPSHFKHFMFPNSTIREMDTKHVPFIEDKEEYFEIIKEFITK